MIHQLLYIGRWDVDFFFLDGIVSVQPIEDALYDAGAPDDVVYHVSDVILSDIYNAGFTYTNGILHRAVIIVGKADSGREFLDTFMHEIFHLADEIASSIGYDVTGERPAYIAGDAARSLAGIVCMLGCSHCSK